MNGAAKGADNHLCRSEPVSVQIPGKYKKFQQIRSSRIAWLPIQMEYRRLYRWQEPNTRGFRSVGLRSAARRGRRPPPLAQPLCYSEPPGFAVAPTSRTGQSSDHWVKFHVYWCWRIDRCAKLELAVGEVYVEDGNIVSVLIGDVKKGSRRIYVHPAGPLPARRFLVDHFELAGFRLDFENRYTVVAAVRIVEVGRQCRDRLLPDERRAYRIIVKDRDR